MHSERGVLLLLRSLRVTELKQVQFTGKNLEDLPYSQSLLKIGHKHLSLLKTSLVAPTHNKLILV